MAIVIEILLFILPLLGLILMSQRPMGADRCLFAKCDPVEILRELTLGDPSKETKKENAYFLIGIICYIAWAYLLIAQISQFPT